MKKKILFTLFIATFCLIVNAQYTKLLDFTGATNGSNPYGSLISDGTFLYGMTRSGGTNDFGTIFKIKSDGTGYTKLHDFDSLNGGNPFGSLIRVGTFLYGTASSGGSYAGVIFKIKNDGTGYSAILDFSGSTNGSEPTGDLIYDGTFLYGVASSGGVDGTGVIFKIKPDGTGASSFFDFSAPPGVNGMFPTGSLISDGGFLYGMTQLGGTSGYGVIFKIDPDGTGYDKFLDFLETTNGSNPIGSLISDSSFLYGMTFMGGANGSGTIFKIKPDGTGYFKLLDFDGINGASPAGSLISDGTFFYGMTAYGGTNGMGIVFRIKYDGTGFSNLADFNGSNGRYANGSLISDGIFLYGMTLHGGTSDKGVIFKNCVAHYTTTYDSIQNLFTLNVDSTITALATSYYWDFGDGTSSTLASPSHIYTADTVYNVCMKIYFASGDSCIYCHEIGKDYLGNIYRNPGFVINVNHTNGTSGISENTVAKNNITVFPNPTNGQFTIVSKENDYKLIITNILGENIYQSQIKNMKAEIDFNKESSGIYFLNIKTEEGTISKKLIINK